jgi:vacuolar-type H+-ATPase subunit E/Vma4
MNEPPLPVQSALQPLWTALLERAQQEADDIRTRAQQDGQRLLASARDGAAQSVARAQAQGRADAGALLAVERARRRRQARAIVLGAQRAAYDELRQQARLRIRGLLDDPARRAQLASRLRDELGAKATIQDHPGGGLVASTPDGRSADAGVDTMVDGAIADLDLGQLWATG